MGKGGEGRMQLLKCLATSAVLMSSVAISDGASLSPEEAVSHVGENATVCGLVASTNYASHVRSQPTFLNLGKPYPNQVFTAVIFGTDRTKFGTPETSLRGKSICVTGSIRLYRGKPEIILRDPKELMEK
jgi:DNA/RNA endonuclease YhcR with UshA esterase domain